MSRIKNYDDLEAEKQRLMALLKNQEELIKVDMAGVREGLQPAAKVYKVLSNMATRDNSIPAMNFGLEMGIDILVRKWLLARAGWFAKIVVPYLVKNYSSHIVAEEKREVLIQKVKDFFNKLRPKTKPEDDEESFTRTATEQ